MKQIQFILMACICLLLSSCDYTMYVAVRNYREPCKVNVTFDKSVGTFFDNDTLSLKSIPNADFDGSLIRNNTGPGTYSFIAPHNKEIALRPVALNRQPISQIEIINAVDSSWVINLRDRAEFQKLKKSGRIKTRRFIVTTGFFIENK